MRWIDIKPLTILLGPNNCGKTSLFCPLLLLKQTMESTDKTLRLRTKGDYVDVGTYRDLIYDHDIGRKLVLELRFLFDKKTKKKKAKSIGDHPPASISLVFRQGEVEDDIELESIAIKDAFGRVMLRRTLTEKGNYSFRFFTSLRENVVRKTYNAILRDKPVHFLFDTHPIYVSLIPEMVEGRTVQEILRTTDLSIPEHVASLVATLFVTNGAVEGLLNNITFIGPLRQHPRRYYERIGERPSSVGPMGEYTPDILLQMKEEASLKPINTWLKEFEISGTIDCVEHVAGVFSVVRKFGKKRKNIINISDTGFGLSQILPLITQGLWMGKGGILIAEQPEIHLNPKLQSKLADFFVHLVDSEKRVILETHSEHLLLRLRTLVAEKEISPSDIALYFLEREGRKTVIRNIPIEDNGHIETYDWPKGFFEDSLRESFNLASAQMRTEGEGNESKSS